LFFSSLKSLLPKHGLAGYWRISPLLFLAILVFPLNAVPMAYAVVSSSSYKVLLEDDFSQGLTKWNPLQGAWAVQNGELHGSSSGTDAVISAGDISWGDYVFSVRVKSVTNSSDILLVRLQGAQNYYRVVLFRDHMEIWLRRSGIDHLLYREKSWGYSINTTDWHQLKVKIYGTSPTITAYWDDYPEITVKDLSNQPISAGMIGLGDSSAAQSAFDTVTVTTLHPDSTGAQKIILLLVEFPDVRHHLTPQQVYDNVFPALNQYYTEASYNLTWVVGSVTPEWRTLQNPSTYYDIAQVTGSGYRNGRDLQFLKDAILAWDNETDYRKYDYVFVCGAGGSVWGYTYFQVTIAKTNDGTTIDRATAQPESDDWNVYAHEFGHLSLGLPDLYSYQIAFRGPPDWREAAVYVGPWDLMSRSNERPQPGAWDEIHVGWIPQSKILEILPDQQGSAMIEPLENPTSGIQAIIIYETPTTYFMVENRQPIGHDSVLPDRGILVSYVDEGKYWRGNGPVVVQDANPTSGPRWQLLHPTFNTGPGAKSQYTNQTYNIAITLLDRLSDNSYLVAVSTPNAVDTAKSAYDSLNQATMALRNAVAAGRLEGLSQANASLQEAWNLFGQGNFQQAENLAKQANAALLPGQTTQQYSLQPLTIIAVVVAVAALGLAAIYCGRRARKPAHSP
jgi:M6 family metalloprotease-like protein